MSGSQTETIKLVLDEKVLYDYEHYYFEKYPRRNKRPIERPIHESLNKWTIMMRPQANVVKQNWKEFICWWMDDLGLSDKQMEFFEMTFVSYMPSMRRCDPDNMVPKFILDGFTESGLIVDDDGQHLKALTIKTDVDKENPRTEIFIKELED